MMKMDPRAVSVALKSSSEINKLRAAGKMAAQLLRFVQSFVKPGVTTEDLDRLCADWAKQRGAVHAPLGYHGYPKHICTSINEVVCHGIPSKRRILHGGDIVNVDVTLILDGWYGDTSETFCVGEVTPTARSLVEVTRECLRRGIDAVKPGARVGDIGAAIQEHAERNGYSVVRDFVGHGLGQQFHVEPQVPHFGKRGKGLRLKPGMVFTIEPMINEGGWPVEVLEDGWTAVTRDRSLSAQHEHTLVVTETGYEVLTAIDGWDPVLDRKYA